jgi:uncharacterized alkaline shock family protein YloU
MTWVVSNEMGTITVPDAVLESIATRAAEDVEGVRVRRRRTVDVEGGVVRLAVSVRRGEPIVAVVSRAQDFVAAALKAMCGIDLAVDVAVGDLS